jgi:hypothetical protein
MQLSALTGRKSGFGREVGTAHSSKCSHGREKRSNDFASPTRCSGMNFRGSFAWPQPVPHFGAEFVMLHRIWRVQGESSLALIGNASGQDLEEREKTRSEAFSIRRLGGSRWRLRRTRCAMGFEC